MSSDRPRRPFLALALVLALGDALGVRARATVGGSAAGAAGWSGAATALALLLALLGGAAALERRPAEPPAERPAGPAARPRPRRRGASLLPVGLAVASLAFLRAAAESPDGRSTRVVTRSGVGVLLAESGSQPPYGLPAGVARPGDLVRAVGAPRAWQRARAPGDAPRVQRWELELEDLDRRARPAPAAPARGLEDLRERAGERLGELRDPDARGLALALLLGDRGELPPGRADLFTRTGTRHLLALSGLHVGLFAWLVVRHAARAAGGFAGRARVAVEALVGAALLLGLAPLAGAGAPVRRACWAGALACLAPLLPSAVPGAGRRVDALSLWSFALALELLAAPGSSAAVGVRLSYAATLGLLLLLPRVLRGETGRAPAVDRLGRARSGYLPCAARRLRRGVRVALAASAVAVLATLPVTWTTFGEVSLVGPLATPLCLPPLVALVAAGLAWTVAPLAWLDPAIQRAVELAAGSLLALLEWADRVPGTPLPLPPRPLGWLALAVTALALGRLRGRACWTRAGLALLGAALLPWTLAPRGLEVVACDVGHGTAVAMRAPGGEVWVFDAGSRDRSGVDRDALGPLLRRWDAGRVTFALSHRHRDHAAALPWLASRWPPERWLGAPPIAADLAGAPQLDLDVGRARDVRRPDLTIELGRGSTTPGNEGSRHVVVTWRGRTVVLLGDAVEDGLAEALDRRLLAGPVDLLVLPHHGGESPHLERLLEASRPRRVWASCSGAAAARAAVSAHGLELATTARDGPLALALPPGGPREALER